MEAAFGVKRCDSEHDGTTETGPLTQSTDESEDISGGAVSDEDQDLRADECDGLAGATTANSGVGCSLADEQVDEKSAWSNDCTGGVSKYRLLDVVEEYVLFRALWHVAAALMTVALRKMNMASLGVEWAKAVGNIALEIKKRYQNKAAYICCVMTIGVAVSVHGSSFMEATDHLPMDVTGTCTLERTVHFAVSVNDNSLKVNTNTSGSDMDYMALYVPIAPIAESTPVTLCSPSPRPTSTGITSSRRQRHSRLSALALRRLQAQKGVAQGIDAIVEAGHKMAGEDSSKGGNKS